MYPWLIHSFRWIFNFSTNREEIFLEQYLEEALKPSL